VATSFKDGRNVNVIIPDGAFSRNRAEKHSGRGPRLEDLVVASCPCEKVSELQACWARSNDQVIQHFSSATFRIFDTPIARFLLCANGNDPITIQHSPAEKLALSFGDTMLRRENPADQTLNANT
jgi:hypothetical protein